MKEPKQILKVEQQVVRVDHEVESADAEHGTELKLMWCLQRRGFALDMTNVVSWHIHEKWVDTLFRAYSTESSAAVRSVSLTQLIKADCEMWMLLAREFQSVRPNAHGEKPLDEAIARYQSDPRIVVHLMPLPSGRSTAAGTGSSQVDEEEPKKKKRPGKRSRNTPNVPEELKEMHQQTSQGKPICWAYNLQQGCKSSAKGNPPTCNRGAHVCAYCRKPGHGLQACRNYKGNKKDGGEGKHWLHDSGEPSQKRSRLNPTDSSARPSSSSKRKDSLEVQQNLKRQKFHDDISPEKSDLQEGYISNDDGSQQSEVHCATVESTMDKSNVDGITQGDSEVSRELKGKGIRNEQDFENLICIEIFSGSGRLTAAIRKLGMRAVAVDRSAQRTKGPVTILDLTKPDDLRYLLNFIESEKDNIMLVHLAPPCGTASAARNRRHKRLEEAGFDLPVPLRSKEFPMGLPTLRGLDLTKVSLANDLYGLHWQ